MKNDKLKIAVSRSCDRGQYPSIFNINVGNDFHLESKPNWFGRIEKPRKVTIEVTSYKFVCGWAEHYYVTIKADGIRICSKEINGKNQEQIVIHSGYLGEEFEQIKDEKKDIWCSIYSIDVLHPVTQEMIEKKPHRWGDYKVGDLTNAFDTKESAIAAAKEIVEARFTKEWDLRINDLA